MGAEYPKSLYAETALAIAGYTALEGNADTDVCVIGAGITGLMAAITLLEAGKHVVVLEKNRVGWGASGRNGGQLIRGFPGQERFAKDPLWDDACIWAGHDLLRQRIKKYDIQCDFVGGWMELAKTARQQKALYKQYQFLSEAYPDRGWSYVDADRVQEETGSSEFKAGLLSHSDAHLHPLKLCQELARVVRELGGQIFEHTEVSAFSEGPSSVTIKTSTGSVEAGQLVVAANVFNVLPMLGLQGQAMASGSYIIATDPVSDDLRATLHKGSYALCNMDTVCDYFRVSADNRVIFGGRVNYSGRKPASIKKELRPRMLRVWPQLADVEISHEWGGRLGVPLAQTPLAGQVSDHVWYACGYTGHGVNTGTLLGTAVASAIVAGDRMFDLFSRYKGWRLPLPECVVQNTIALAAFYFVLRDRL
ncbi:gamma-glutamylputrescine oxidoreductase [Kordiimonas sediminis]|uniref:Gamma-glutamylputrescine oxidoreductase n=1 Tax=Kordiimonas sediminis TaxID=1735581 RepID=A0A919EB44_9PROT|nr:FAD-binding oxidoreductase [Kordiimonas sediminis]GHF30334.1 gamma-glutamylputrescine oxidoreductase [Kordiimonas sediminis]